MACPAAVAGGAALPPETDRRRVRRVHFAGFEGLLTAGQRRVVELHYVGGRHGRSRTGPARDRVGLHKALRRLAEGWGRVGAPAGDLGDERH